MSTGKIFQQIPLVMRDLEAIGKNSFSEHNKFNFRGIDAVYNELHGHLAKHGVFTAPEVLESIREERTTKNGGVMTYTIAKIKFKFYAEDGSFFETTMIGEGADSGDKSSNKAMSIAHKYAFLQVFSIPTEDEKDPDAKSHELTPRPSGTQSPVKPNSEPAITKPNHPSEAQLKRLFAISNKCFWKHEDIRAYINSAYKIDSTKDLTLKQYDDFIKIMETQTPPRTQAITQEWDEPGSSG